MEVSFYATYLACCAGLFISLRINEGVCRSPLIYFLCPESRRFEHRSQRPFFSFRLFMMSTGRGSFALEYFVRQISVQSARIIVPASSRMLVCNTLPGLCIHDNSLLHKLKGTSREGSLPGDSRSETSREDNPVLRSIFATASNRCEFQV